MRGNFDENSLPLGAGASKPAGLLVMSDFLEILDIILERGGLCQNLNE